MNFTEQEISIMDDYINNNLSQERKIIFDESMKRQDFKDEVLLKLSILKELQSEANKKLKEDILSFSEDTNSREIRDTEINTKEKSNPNKYLKYLVGLLLIVALGILLFWAFNKNNQVDQLYAATYETYPAQEIQRGKIEQQNIDYIAAMELYRNGDYEAALNGFKALDMNDQSLNLYIGVSQMELEQFSDAQSSLIKVKSSTDVGIRQAAEWYETLILLKTGDETGFNSAVKNIIDDESHLFNRKAKELQSKL